MTERAASFRCLTNLPLFSLTNAVPEHLEFKKLFKNWPKESESLLTDAQNARDLLEQHLKIKNSMQIRLNDISKYLPLALAIEKELQNNPAITTTNNKIVWKQAPIVVPGYQDRSFSGKYFSNEVLHCVWLQANLMLNEGYLISQNGDYDNCVKLFREMAGIFNYLAGDRLRVICGEAVPIEFKAAVFQSLTNLALGQAYSCICAKAERDGLKPLNLAKIANAVATTIESALDSFNTSDQQECFHPQYKLWLQCQSEFFRALSALYMSFHLRQSKMGMAIACARFGVELLKKVSTTPQGHERLVNASKALLEEAEPYAKGLGEENFAVMNDVVPDSAEAEATIAASCTMMPNLPQPLSYVLPEPSLVMPTDHQELSQSWSGIRKIIPPK